ncbi:FAD/NAD(P)-binding domain-containing protein [Cucurbitaria berberidis CBS 394.84]|uniref:FAD/NAD(P)-binding domain-containing protein n=1 Tax=Cucurbitaria berberidis CBS 394.84 TaxID=1168544 RepID=A0A9P4GK71_9PLEO|nr:FAD/NAD(P)-binding domain-containing protein [Cucurbitaria berberidis CBS 394.84]KAF1847080.1 FAD/NAD(P)-binding domain-containing protein [Cucurbitaria berberidis CBS 394.84]
MSNTKGNKRGPNVAAKDTPSWLTTAANSIHLFSSVLGLVLPYGIRLLRLRITTIYHTFTYKAIDSPKNIVVVGGSFAGIHVANWLANAVPTGYRVVLVEKNSHFNYLFAFPRYAVVTGYEQGAFIPYENILSGAIKKGSLLHIHEKASGVTPSQVLLADGQAIDYAYLIVATGSSQPPPAKMASTGREGACDELHKLQRGVAEASRIAVLGSGAVGVEMAADIKTYFPDKSVTLFSSRDVVMPSFGPKLQLKVANILESIGVTIRYNARPQTLPGSKMIQLQDRSTEEYDLVLSCTGQNPNSGILSTFLPEVISKQTGRILVKPTLQLQPAGDSAFPNIFALGDVAEHGGPRMARAVHVQAGIVRDNILELIKGRSPSHEYSPQRWIEGSIQMTVGKDQALGYIPGDNSKDVLFTLAAYPDDFRIAHGWRLLGAKYPGRPRPN